ncbi:precorrin-6y C5,15-methyltransferase (decarboxylating) subunit CbiE [Amphritea balenae]|uniref:Precorrin-6y C5,15-methyltransferase (Decarboxylating) subunit CbiE n=1 Tax=Amphritea balenae TaxID=452629 RepID=A0A3P1SW04_9GAMM|nr:precorrin-6y C5,15-methyltransferase (decarboxylating) subunit CbiE [Amphritea balenae]RRD00726.1 precorrin-6y C5,15-methyltransferase (decarboxylating) subunit CbiE [Amphritea balenae]GGK68294.1 precorrin-6Y methyltransferase [Amphritea balenae]
MQLHIIGLGVSETAHLDQAALTALQAADSVIGAERQLATVQHLLSTGQEQIILPKLSRLKEQLTAQADKDCSIAVLASGDPLLYGIGRWFSRTFNPSDLSFYPAVSSIQAACHRLGRAFQDLTVLSLHGRPLAKVRTQLKRNQALIILTDKHSTPQALAQECIAAGFPDSKLTVLEMLGYEQEKISLFSALELAEQPLCSELTFDPLHVTLIDPLGAGGVFPEFPGIPDESFVTDSGEGKGMITKREVRLSILSLLQPSSQDCIWDIGAGCGGVSVELSYWNADTSVHAIEYHPARLACLAANQQRFGVVSNLHVVEGRAPEVLSDLPKPNKVFIGGSGGELAQLLTQAWSVLPVGGVLVVSAVTETTRQQVFSFYQARQAAQDSDFESMQVAVSKGDLLAGQLMYRPTLPVVLTRYVKLNLNAESSDD